MDTLKYLVDIYQYYALFTLIYMRIFTFLHTLTIFKSEAITVRVIASLAFIMSLLVFLKYAMTAQLQNIGALDLAMNLFYQFIIGLSFAIIINFLFEAFNFAGQFISSQIGLSMASIVDNRFGFITPLTHFYYVVLALMFFLLNGHLYLIKLIMTSFDVYPLFNSNYINIFPNLFQFSTIIFTQSLMISIIILLVILLSNLSIAVLSKFAPQFNIFSIGINIQIILGLIVIYLTFSLLIDGTNNAITQHLNNVYHALIGVSHGR